MPSCTVSCRLRRALVVVLALLALVGVGRLGQVAWESHYSGARGPYLQVLTASSVTIRWQSGADEQGLVRYGTEPDKLDHVAREPKARLAHEVRLDGLAPATRYYYAVGSAAEDFAAGAEHWFVTAPSPGSVQPVRVWVQGDPGWWHGPSQAVHAAMLRWVEEHPRPGRPPLDLWLTTGDNAYRSGSSAQFQAALFDAYPQLLPNTPYLPVYGNHDARRWAFFDIFTFPAAGEAGGVASGTEHYFSYDYANIHFVVLDSEASSLAADGPMAQWLQRDLATNKQRWLIVLFHHPPYTKGSHDSDDDWDSEGRMREVRENILPLLEAAGADLVLAGHSHVYERSHLLRCHYGDSSSLIPAMIADGSGGAAPYRKALTPAAHDGTVYAVVGSSTNLDDGPLNHPAMAASLHERGSLLLDVVGDRLRAEFVTADGVVGDAFTIEKVEQVPVVVSCGELEKRPR